MHELAFAVWFFVPAGLANAAPVIANIIPGVRRLDYPLDGGHSWRGKRIFGAHKTWRGLIAGMVVATLILWCQQLLVGHFAWAHYASDAVDYATLPTLVLGPLFGLGALGGDAIESFFKRRMNRADGAAWVPFDQIDYVLGGLVASLVVIRLRPLDYLAIILIWFAIHFGGSYVGYLLGLKERPL